MVERDKELCKTNESGNYLQCRFVIKEVYGQNRCKQHCHRCRINLRKEQIVDATLTHTIEYPSSLIRESYSSIQQVGLEKGERHGF